MFRRMLACAVLLFGALFATAPSADAKKPNPMYAAVALPHDFLAADINNYGEVIGTYLLPDFTGGDTPYGGMLYLHNGQAHHLMTLPDPSVLTGTAPSGNILTGALVLGDGQMRNFAMTWEDTYLVEGENVFLNGVNDFGQIAGLEVIPSTSGEGMGEQHLLRYHSPNASPERLTTTGFPVGISRDGTIPYASFSEQAPRQTSHVWKANGETATLGNGSVMGMNSHGSLLAGVVRNQAAIWDGTGMRNLGLGRFSAALDVNNNGDVIGVARKGRMPFLHTWGKALDLNKVSKLPAGWKVSVPLTINDRGDILALARSPRNRDLLQQVVLVRNP